MDGEQEPHLGPKPGSGDVGKEGRTGGRQSAAGRKVSSGQLSGCPRPATPQARPQTKIKRRIPGPSAPSLASRYAASRARPAPVQDFIGGPAAPRLRPPPAAAPPLSARATAVREPPAGAGAVRGELGSGRLWSRRRQLALHCCPGDPERRRYGTQTTSCESQEAPRPGALIL